MPKKNPMIAAPMKKGDANAWVREGLKLKGYSQKDLARAWGVAEPSISRFISGEEQIDPQFSRVIILASMLGITLEDVAKGLGLQGKRIEPIITQDAGMPPVGTFRMDTIEPGRVRVVMHQDLKPEAASKLVMILAGG